MANFFGRHTVRKDTFPKEDTRTPLYLMYGVDCSGSMSEDTRVIGENGETKYVRKIDQANEGFKLCAKSINRFAKENTRFLPKWQVVELNTYCKPIFSDFVTVHDHTLTESQFKAEGSTNIEALFNSFASFITQKHLGGYNRAVNIIVISDGVPTDIDGWALSETEYKKRVDKFKAYLDEHDFSRNVEFYFIAVGDDAEPFGRYFAGDEHFFKVDECESIADKLDFVTRQTLADSTTIQTNPIDFSDDDEEDDDEDIDEAYDDEEELDEDEESDDYEDFEEDEEDEDEDDIEARKKALEQYREELIKKMQEDLDNGLFDSDNDENPDEIEYYDYVDEEEDNEDNDDEVEEDESYEEDGEDNEDNVEEDGEEEDDDGDGSLDSILNF